MYCIIKCIVQGKQARVKNANLRKQVLESKPPFDIALKGKGKGKGKVQPRTGHEGPEGDKRYSYTLSLTSALDEVGGQRHAPAALPPGKRPGTHCIGSWVAPRAGLDVCGNISSPTGI